MRMISNLPFKIMFNFLDDWDSLYYVSPDIDPWVFVVAIIIMAFIGACGMFGNSAIMFAYIKNKSVSEFN